MRRPVGIGDPRGEDRSEYRVGPHPVVESVHDAGDHSFVDAGLRNDPLLDFGAAVGGWTCPDSKW